MRILILVILLATACGRSTDILPVSDRARATLCNAALTIAAEQNYRDKEAYYRAAAAAASQHGVEIVTATLDGASVDETIAAANEYGDEAGRRAEGLIAGSRADLARTIHACAQEYGE